MVALSFVFLFGGVALSRAGMISDAGQAIALFAWLLLTVIGLPVLLGAARGPLRVLARPPWQVELNAEGATWRRGGTASGSARWQDVGGVDAMKSRYVSWTVVRDMTGGETVKLFGTGFRAARTGWKGTLAEAVVAVRADRYELVPHGRFDASRSAVIRLTGNREPHGTPQPTA